MEIVFIDHYDSFSYNVIEWIRKNLPQHWNISTVYCDDQKSLSRLTTNPRPMVLSPGPGRPESYPYTIALVRKSLGRAPLLGICLGHQILGVIGDAPVIRSKAPFHGSCRNIVMTTPLFGIDRGTLPPVAVYHSLVVDATKLQPPWRVLGTDSLGEVAALEWPGTLECSGHGSPGGNNLWPAVGLQFHPESYMSLQSEYLIQGWFNRDVIPWHLAASKDNLQSQKLAPKNNSIQKESTLIYGKKI